MSAWVWIVVVLVAVVVVAAVVWRALVARRSALLREQFGSEYDRTVKSFGSRRKAESELVERQERHERLQIVGVTAEARQRYLREWQFVQGRFLKAPVAAVAAADALVVSVMSDRGYPMLVGVEQRLADVSVDDPEAVGAYRKAYEVYRRCDEGKATTGDLQRAMQDYDRFLTAMLNGNENEGVGEDSQADDPAADEDAGIARGN